MNIPRLAVLCLLATLAMLQPARANLISGTITGSVVSAGTADAALGMGVGSVVSGSYTYDDSILLGLYRHPLTAFSLVIGTNPHVFTFADLDDLIKSNVDTQLSTATVDNLFFFLGEPAALSYLGTVGESGIIGPPQQQYEFEPVNVADDPAYAFVIDFLATRQTAISAVPEPDLVELLLIGAVGMGASRRRRSS